MTKRSQQTRPAKFQASLGPVVPPPGQHGDRGRIKGAPLREFVIWVEEHWGPEVLRRAHASLPEDQRRQLDPHRPALGVLAASWYPGDMTLDLLEALFEGRTEQERTRAISEATARAMNANLGGIYKRFFIRLFMSPKQYVVHVNKLWSLHFDTGTITAKLVSETRIHWQIQGWRTHHPLLCRFVLCSEPAVFGAMGCKNVRTQLASNAPGFDCTHYIEWDAVDAR